MLNTSIWEVFESDNGVVTTDDEVSGEVEVVEVVKQFKCVCIVYFYVSIFLSTHSVHLSPE